jgi:hypothetical protein
MDGCGDMSHRQRAGRLAELLHSADPRDGEDLVGEGEDWSLHGWKEACMSPISLCAHLNAVTYVWITEKLLPVYLLPRLASLNDGHLKDQNVVTGVALLLSAIADGRPGAELVEAGLWGVCWNLLMKLLGNSMGNWAALFASYAIVNILLRCPWLLEDLATSKVAGGLVDTMRNALEKESGELENGPIALLALMVPWFPDMFAGEVACRVIRFLASGCAHQTTRYLAFRGLSVQARGTGIRGVAYEEICGELKDATCMLIQESSSAAEVGEVQELWHALFAGLFSMRPVDELRGSLSQEWGEIMAEVTSNGGISWIPPIIHGDGAGEGIC